MELSDETREDWWAVEALYDLTFAPGRKALSSYRLRDDVPPVPTFCRVVRDDDGTVGGAIRCWPIRIEQHDALLLGPVSVHPTRQGEGLGGLMIRDVLDRAQPPTNPDRVLGFGSWAGVRGRVRKRLD